MVICNNCGVALDDDVPFCLLCGNPVNSNTTAYSEKLKSELEENNFHLPYRNRTEHAPQRKVTWEVVSIVLLSIIIVTSIINLIINKKITWSEYPIAICLIVFAYISVFAFWVQRTILQIIVCFLAAASSLFLLDLLTYGLAWAPTLAIPLLLVTNIVVVGLIQSIRSCKQKGVNLIAYSFLAAAILCICIEAIFDLYLNHPFRLVWSPIIGICVLPVSIVLLLTHYRYKKGRDLQKTFHI